MTEPKEIAEPNREAWEALVAYAQTTGDGPLAIYQITSHYLKMQEQRDKLADLLEWLFTNHEDVIIEAKYAVSFHDRLVQKKTAIETLDTARAALAELKS